MVAWDVAQAAYAAAKTLFANSGLNAAKDAAEKQYDIADHQKSIVNSEHKQYRITPCETPGLTSAVALFLLHMSNQYSPPRRPRQAAIARAPSPRIEGRR